MTTRPSRKTPAAVAAIGLGLLVALVGLSNPASAAPKVLEKLTICHRTNAPSNPYREVTISFDASNGQLVGPDHTGHPGPAFDFTADPADPGYPYTTPRSGDQWGDIIPPYSWAGGSYPGSEAYLGGGADILASGCGVPAAPTGSITLDKVTAGDGQPIDTTPFTFSITCEDATVPEAAPEISPADPVATIALDIAEGTSCTIDETDSAGGVATFSVDGGPAVAGPVVVTLDDVEDAVAIVVTNTFACPAGQTPDGEGGCVPPVDACPDVDGIQADTTECPPPVDACPTVDGVQASAAECPAEVIPNVVTPTTKPTPQVKGTQTLPRTGDEEQALALVGFGLVLLGAGALIARRDSVA